MGRSKASRATSTKVKPNDKEEYIPAATSREGKTWKWLILTVAVGCCMAYGHWYFVSGMFENDRQFSHLATFEREIGFRTEMGLYYSYFKTIVTAPSYSEGVGRLVRDNLTEYPSTINVLKRFNLYPELVTGALYRTYVQVSASVGHKTKQCWTVNRGKDLPPVQSCEGLGEAPQFYVSCVFFLAGVAFFIFYLLAVYLSDSIWGGIIATACFFFNHTQCTRVQWTPPLRESFGFCFHVCTLVCVSIILKTNRPRWWHSLMLAMSTVVFMLCWQFAQFALLTQLLSVFAVFALKLTTPQALRAVVLGHELGLLTSYVLLFGNEMLLTSFFAAALVTVHVLLVLDEKFQSLGNQLIVWSLQGAALVTGAYGVKTSLARLLGTGDDAHIWDILRSKFSDYSDFHTMLYTCAREFDFMEIETLWEVSKSLMLPCCVVVVTAVVYQILAKVMHEPKEEVEEKTKESPGPAAIPSPELVYQVVQLAAYTILAVVIMRLKLFWTPQLCLVAGLLASRHLFPRFTGSRKRFVAFSILIGLMSYQGTRHMLHFWSIRGSFSAPHEEELVNWINQNTPQNAVFAGDMPMMATIKLTTERPIVNHPHYEDTAARERNKRVYQVFSRRASVEVHLDLRELQVNYLLLSGAWCFGRRNPGCAMVDIWDREDVSLRHKEPFCKEVVNSNLFEVVFRNRAFMLLKLL